MEQKSRWTRRVTVIGDRPCKDDWTISHNGRDVGRVLFTTGQNGAPNWKWASWDIPAQSGREETLEAACDSLRRAILARKAD